MHVYIWMALVIVIVLALILLCWFCGELARIVGFICAGIVIAIFIVVCVVQ